MRQISEEVSSRPALLRSAANLVGCAHAADPAIFTRGTVRQHVFCDRFGTLGVPGPPRPGFSNMVYLLGNDSSSIKKCKENSCQIKSKYCQNTAKNSPKSTSREALGSPGGRWGPLGTPSGSREALFARVLLDFECFWASLGTPNGHQDPPKQV